MVRLTKFRCKFEYMNRKEFLEGNKTILINNRINLHQKTGNFLYFKLFKNKFN